MSLSKQWTVGLIWDEVFTKRFGNLNHPIVLRKYEIINHSTNLIASILAPIYQKEYTVDRLIASLSGGYYYFTDGESDIYLSQQDGFIYLQSDNNYFSDDMLNRIIMVKLVDDQNIYLGTIVDYVNEKKIRLEQNSIELSNGTYPVMMFMISSSPYLYDEIDISNLNMQRIADNVNIRVHSSIYGELEYLPHHNFSLFDSNIANNKYRMVYTYYGNKVLLKRGAGFNNYGILKLSYIRQPIPVVADYDYIDLPDGLPITLLITMLKRSIEEDIAGAKTDNFTDINSLINIIFSVTKSTSDKELIERKIGEYLNAGKR